MKRDQFIKIIREFEEWKLPPLIERDIDFTLPTVKKAMVIIGPRRAGKTFYCYNLIQNLEMSGVSRTKILYVNLEDDRLNPLTLGDLDVMLRTYYEVHPKNKEATVHLFLDEIQVVNGWEQFVRRVLDTENIQVYLTGSSSRMLSTEIATSLRGRALTYTILPFSFIEYLKSQDFNVEEFMSTTHTGQLISYLTDFIEYGGFPEVILEQNNENKSRILKEYVEVMLLRDVIERYNIQNTGILKLLFRGLVSSTSSSFSKNKFYNFLKSTGKSLSKNTIYNYMKNLEDAYVIHSLRSFSYSLKNVEQSLPKVYPIDSGLLRIHGYQFSENRGMSIENVVAIELLRRKSITPELDIYYWRSNQTYEVDFVLCRGKKVDALTQVCYDITAYETKEREVKSLIKASNDLHCDNLTIITWDKEDSELINGKKISYVPLWKWLISGEGMRNERPGITLGQEGPEARP